MAAQMHGSRSFNISRCSRRPCPPPAVNDSAILAAWHASACRCKRNVKTWSQPSSEGVIPENIDLEDPELQAQINALLKDLDPELLLDDTEQLIAGVEAAAAASQAKQQAAGSSTTQQQQQQQLSSVLQAEAWQDDTDDEDTEAGLPEGVLLTKAEYKRKAAVLVELMAAQQSEGAEEALAQKMSAFKIEIDEALLHMLGRRLHAAQEHQQESTEVGRLQELYDLLQLEYERLQATPAMRLLDEVLDLVGDDPYVRGGRETGDAIVQRLRKAFTGGVADDIDIFAAAAALAADKAVAAEALTVEYVPQASFVAEGMELLQKAKDEMQQLALAVTQAQAELQQVRNSQPELLETPEAQQHIQQIAAADEILQQRKAAVGQVAYVLDIAQDLDAAEQRFADSGVPQDNVTGEGMPSPEQIATLLGIE